ncbi:hypothetical protein RJG79_03745 [Mycoplasmatota bacterium WC44]
MTFLFDPLISVPYDISKGDLKKVVQTEFEVDLHGLIYTVALTAIQRIVKYAPKHIKSIYVIHGYIGGTDLKKMITKQNLKSSRIKHVNPTFNPGQSVIIFKDFEE